MKNDDVEKTNAMRSASLYPDDVKAALNTDKEIWRERPKGYYSDSIHVTKDGNIGINCGGFVIVKSVREWHRLARLTPADTGEALEALDRMYLNEHTVKDYLFLSKTLQAQAEKDRVMKLMAGALERLRSASDMGENELLNNQIFKICDEPLHEYAKVEGVK